MSVFSPTFIPFSRLFFVGEVTSWRRERMRAVKGPSAAFHEGLLILTCWGTLSSSSLLGAGRTRGTGRSGVGQVPILTGPRGTGAVSSSLSSSPLTSPLLLYFVHAISSSRCTDTPPFYHDTLHFLLHPSLVAPSLRPRRQGRCATKERNHHHY